MSESKNRVLVIGAGAVGVLYSGRLARAGFNVSVVARSDYDAVKADGYAVKSVDGDFRFQPESVYRSAEEAGKGWDYVIVATKAVPSLDPAELLRPVAESGTAAVILQNGIRNEESVYRAYEENGVEVIGGLAFVCAARTGPASIHHQDYGGLTLGSYPSGVSEKCRALAEGFNAAGVQCRTTIDLAEARWKKLCWNAAFNPLSVLSGGRNTEELVHDPDMAETVLGVMREVMALSVADGHGFDEEHVDRNFEDTLRMKPYEPSMLLDFKAGRPMEVDAILGRAVHLARDLGISVPRLETLFSLLKLVDGRA
jgi:2-dehydropantoate 2-reductase